MHYIILADSYVEMHSEFANWLRSRKYEPNRHNWNVQVREIKLYDLVFPEEIEPKVKEDLKYFTNKSCAGSLSEISKLVKFLRTILSIKNKNLKEINLDDSKDKLLKDMDLPGGNDGFWMAITPIAKLEDGYENDVELL